MKNLYIPQHIGIIMDGNGRWAKKRGLPRVMGHRKGTEATHIAVESCGKLGIKYLTIYVFSAENWKRPENEVKTLMDLLVEMIKKELKALHENNVKLHAIGELERLPELTLKELQHGIEETKNNTGLNLILALSYGGRREILRAAKLIAKDVQNKKIDIDSLDEDQFKNYLYTSDIPDPELIIRTGGEYRISNFLLWQSAYAELYITNVLWPDFREKHLIEAIKDFNKRERRFGKVLDS